MWSAFALAFLSVSWAQSPSPSSPLAPAQPATESGPQQPIPFSHKVHAGTLAMACDGCHTFSHSGETLGIPQANTCMQCHQTIAASELPIQKLAAYAKSGAIIPWVRVYQLPDFVTFSHKTHLDHGITCQNCHGKVATRDRLFQESDISMAGCTKCHTTKKAATECNTCHQLQQ